ncbi:uncharacterized protein LOC111380022 [Olea europaea var. sylvestris]|uniref:uncharacterized protein LOC111380022 n=1 Tax=Olea europaea var. sylvestris TaxID=158386 RepID=UPI000C1CE7DA|nr:uncharacterized protein LOC111380022 [Olea europaea var. sylvestris]
MASNIVESINAVTKAAKNYPIVSLLESLRQTIQSWFCRHGDDAHGTFTKLSTKYEKEIRKMSMDLRNLRVIFYILTLRCICDPIDVICDVIVYSLSTLYSDACISFKADSVFCQQQKDLQVDLLPCPQALAVIANTRRDPYDYCSYYYTRDAYLNAYQDFVYSVGNQEEWTVPEVVQREIVLSPNQKRSFGRPTEKRKRSSREGRPTAKCGRCEGHGHNRRRCSNLAPLRQNNR